MILRIGKLMDAVEHIVGKPKSEVRTQKSYYRNHILCYFDQTNLKVLWIVTGQYGLGGGNVSWPGWRKRVTFSWMTDSRGYPNCRCSDNWDLWFSRTAESILSLKLYTTWVLFAGAVKNDVCCEWDWEKDRISSGEYWKHSDYPQCKFHSRTPYIHRQK